MKNLKFFGSILGIGILLAVLAVAQAQTVPASADHGNAVAHAARVQERENLRRERETIDKTLQQAEAACYQRFAVEDCLSQARSHAREARALVRQRELALDGAERRERAAQRLSEVQERESTRVPPTPHQGSATDRASQTDRDRQAAQRAQTQQEALAAHQASQAAQTQGRADEAARARQNQAEKRQAAQQRRARVQQSQADRAAAGHKTPAPLPAVP